MLTWDLSVTAELIIASRNGRLDMSNANEIIESICQADVGYIDVGVF